MFCLLFCFLYSCVLKRAYNTNRTWTSPSPSPSPSDDLANNKVGYTREAHLTAVLLHLLQVPNTSRLQAAGGQDRCPSTTCRVPRQARREEAVSLPSAAAMAGAEVGEDKYRSFIHGEGERDTVWRYGAPPNYDVVNKLFEEERTQVYTVVRSIRASPLFSFPWIIFMVASLGERYRCGPRARWRRRCSGCSRAGRWSWCTRCGPRTRRPSTRRNTLPAPTVPSEPLCSPWLIIITTDDMDRDTR